MTLYLGRDKVKIHLNNVTYYLNLFFNIPIINGVGLLSSEGYMLKDSNGLYLTDKESD